MKIVIIHGTMGSPDGNWFPWLKKELEAKGHEVYIPKLPTPVGQSVKNWCKELDKQAPIFDKDTVLIGHSCGATYLLHILEVVKESVAKSIFVSGFLDELGFPEFDKLNKTFIDKGFDWGLIKKNAGDITIFHGDDDPYIPLPFAEKLAKGLNTNITVIKNGGHLNAESGYNKFQELLEVL